MKTSTSPLATLGSVTSFLAATPINQIMIGTTRSGISYIYCGMYTPYADAAGMLFNINGKFTMGKLTLILFGLKE